MKRIIETSVFDGALIGDGCWEWQYSTQRNGYGQVMADGRTWVAHRRAWTEWFGPIPDGMWVLHHCDNRRCLRPAHLYLGTNADNMRDCASRGRLNSQHRGLGWKARRNGI